MEKDKIFFGAEGLTTTSANHIANLTKEAYQALEKKLSSAVFYTTKIGLIGSPITNTLKEGVDNTFLEDLESSLMYIAKCKSLIAWLREAIKAKERLIKEATGLTDDVIAEKLDIKIPTFPAKYPRITEEDVVATWNVKQRNRYYYVDTVCSTIGKYIHPNMDFSNAKEDLVKIMSERHRAIGTGRDTAIYTYTPTVSLEKVEGTFFDLQNKYREYQAELNSMKHQIELAIQEDDREKSQKEIEEAQIFKMEGNVIVSQLSEYRKNAIRDAQSLKIIIPDSLKEVFKAISEMGK